MEVLENSDPTSTVPLPAQLEEPLDNNSCLNSIPAHLRLEHQKILHIWRVMKSLHLNPKKFIMAFLSNNHVELVHNNGKEGKENWNNYILDEAKLCLASDGPSSHARREGVTWFSANSIGPTFFSAESRLSRDEHLMNVEMPFLYQLIKSKVSSNSPEDFEDKQSKEGTSDLRGLIDLEDNTLPYDSTSKEGSRVERRGHSVSLGACSMTVHTKTIETTSRSFHGTWGYLHSADPQLLAQVNDTDLSLDSYKKSIAGYADKIVKPSAFFPTNEQSQHFQAVVKSQISQVLFSCVAKIKDHKTVPQHPPPIDPIRPHVPDITMLKMMIASDNSSEGIGEVLTGITNQTNETPIEAAGHLQVMEGDLGTYCNLESLRALRRPTTHPDESLGNIFMLLGASHILWNIAQAILLLHFGDSSNCEDLGAWHTMESLGIAADRPITKKTLRLWYQTCKGFMKDLPSDLIGQTQAQNLDEELPLWDDSRAQTVIDQCYERLFSPKARRAAEKEATKKDSPNPKLANLLLRLHDFATVIEADRAMKAGDIGRLLNMWRMWSVMAQGIKGLNKYAIHLPRMLILLTDVLPPGLQKVLQHSMLITPSGRAGHFVGKDFFLEVQNCWLKYVYNNSGIGTNIRRLMDVFSLNISMLRELVRDMAGLLGNNYVQQSHKCRLTTASINSFLEMANQYDPFGTSKKQYNFTPPAIIDIYKKGMVFIKENSKSVNKDKINRFNPAHNLSFEELQLNHHDSETEDEEGI
ncbi:hypothetical protein Pst134EA_000286 [Puccinia striiformis f. sp. tritici]|uniref:hypothetical protein n=1 Tax=Puccinia striiformis f. sp. tritici TaxID=168172 RepID=UPI0020082456|nr:hypothetical protein Pst134EA_000286 [Puccinia striiformis f. sp. tritici]KAH9473211.1 hypothetical protein Pst134EA_000286 [Puccinia striiformis f. sp. tritici]